LPDIASEDIQRLKPAAWIGSSLIAFFTHGFNARGPRNTIFLDPAFTRVHFPDGNFASVATNGREWWRNRVLKVNMPQLSYGSADSLRIVAVMGLPGLFFFKARITTIGSLQWQT
jgi:hypothetical protein